MHWNTPDYIIDSPSIFNQAAICTECTSCTFVSRAAQPGQAAEQPRSQGHGCGMLSPEPESGAALPKPLRDPVCRPQPSAQSPKEEATRGAEKRKRRRRRKKGGSKQTCPTTPFGRKQSSMGSVSAQETSCCKVRE